MITSILTVALGVGSPVAPGAGMTFSSGGRLPAVDAAQRIALRVVPVRSGGSQVVVKCIRMSAASDGEQ